MTKHQKEFLKGIHKQPIGKIDMLLYMVEEVSDKTPDDLEFIRAILDEIERRKQDND